MLYIILLYYSYNNETYYAYNLVRAKIHRCMESSKAMV